ncbi:MAG: hypothetical protein AUK47_17460 [Deltaproteobacteria bacterium CG2_30_63_29]|nr:MAG: hypothetical protein AUK47_17460 [Deltaproteobacteria bacterium CG2_30_63_29]PIV98608.1 MAG: 16S rRNA (cytosine(967)-C(5))-methyltransferase RsmB [Deltaproteobacteria bacterium CG17_big_fil_post_rev_8_21_14_2_50_63_7]PJB35513.1 MAG: 16S rRNA (cytosine(967)-C(5))-methyltransferase RsmB [Deltaproteobacteria bacterium CG_4_9_14_3_um_filter_63_12]
MSQPISARNAAAQTLMRIERDAAYSHVALDAILRRINLSAQDRGLATRIVYGTLAMQRRLDYELEYAIGGRVEERTEPFVCASLRAALYQIRFLDRIPTHAVLDETVEEVKKQCGNRAGGFVNAVLRRLTRDVFDPAIVADPIERFGLQYSLPDGLVRRSIERFGEEGARQWAIAVNEPAPVTLRVNRSRATVEAVVERLGGRPCQWAEFGVVVESLDSTVRKAIHDGVCWVQDEGSQLIVEVGLEPAQAGVEPIRVWDMCAGQGGKTIQLGDRFASVGVKAQITATDVHSGKLERLRAAWRKGFAGVGLETLAIDASVGLSERRFDLVLLDAPCSGLGLVRRHPEMRWRYDPQAVLSLAKLQRELLDNAAAHIDEGGVLVYAVCTNTHEETEAQIFGFLSRHPEFVLSPSARMRQITTKPWLELEPHTHGSDGFFTARFVRGPRAPLAQPPKE